MGPSHSLKYLWRFAVYRCGEALGGEVGEDKTNVDCGASELPAVRVPTDGGQSNPCAAIGRVKASV